MKKVWLFPKIRVIKSCFCHELQLENSLAHLSVSIAMLLACLGLVVFFAFWYWIADTCNWGQILNREGQWETQLSEFIYFSIGTFSRIGYGDQIPVGANRWIAGIEAFSNYAI